MMNAFDTDNSDNEAKLISSSPAKVPISEIDGGSIMEEEKLYILNDDMGKDTSIGQQFNINSIYEHLSDASEIEELDSVTENDQKRDSFSCSVNYKKLSQAVSTSSLQMDKESSVYSKHVSEKTPLLKDESSLTGFCSDCNIEGEISETSCECSNFGDKDSDHSSLNNVSITSQTKEYLMMPGSIRAPIVGHEIVEARAKFTMFKIHVAIEVDDSGWFIFRRYSDFVHLNDQLKELFPNFRLSLPPKRWFRSNFDSEFLEERLLGLQAFVDNVTGHRDICNSKPVRNFFCFDDPPGPHDSLEESRAQCECMEETIYTLKNELSEKNTEIQLLKEELNLYKQQVQLLSSRFNQLNRRSSCERPGLEKHRSSSNVRQISVDTLSESGDQLLSNKLNSVCELKSPDVKKKGSATDL